MTLSLWDTLHIPCSCRRCSSQTSTFSNNLNDEQNRILKHVAAILYILVEQKQMIREVWATKTIYPAYFWSSLQANNDLMSIPQKKIWKKQKERLQSKKLYHSGIMVLPNTGWTWKTPVTGGCNIVGIQFFPRPWTSWRSCTRTEVPIQRLNRWGPFHAPEKIEEG